MMTPEEARDARHTLGLSQDDLATTFDLTAPVIEAWERGSVSIPRRFEERLRYDAAARKRSALLAASGLPECKWINAWNKELIPRDSKGPIEHLKRGVEHLKTCPVCIAREKYAEQRLGKMPALPLTGYTRVLAAIAARVEKLPRSVQPAAWGALGFGAYSLVKVVAWLPRLIGNPSDRLVALEGLALSMSIGAGVGLLYSAFREVKQKLRPAP